MRVGRSGGLAGLQRLRGREQEGKGLRDSWRKTAGRGKWNRLGEEKVQRKWHRDDELVQGEVSCTMTLPFPTTNPVLMGRIVPAEPMVSFTSCRIRSELHSHPMEEEQNIPRDYSDTLG